MHEYCFSINDFGNPKIYEDAEAMSVILTRLLLLEPGTFQSHPNMGVGLVSKYRYSFAGRATELKEDFEKQIALYLPTFQGVKINVTESNNTYYITAEINKVLYGIVVKDDMSTTASYKSLSDITN